jgi:hypothetical protein
VKQGEYLPVKPILTPLERLVNVAIYIAIVLTVAVVATWIQPGGPF